MQVQSSAWNLHRVLLDHVHVGQVGGKEEIIPADRGTQQQWARVPDTKYQFGEKPGALVKEPFLPQAGRIVVAMPTEYRKQISILEDARPVIGRRCCSSDVILLCGVYLNQLELRRPSQCLWIARLLGVHRELSNPRTFVLP